MFYCNQYVAKRIPTWTVILRFYDLHTFWRLCSTCVFFCDAWEKENTLSFLCCFVGVENDLCNDGNANATYLLFLGGAIWPCVKTRIWLSTTTSQNNNNHRGRLRRWLSEECSPGCRETKKDPCLVVNVFAQNTYENASDALTIANYIAQTLDLLIDSTRRYPIFLRTIGTRRRRSSFFSRGKSHSRDLQSNVRTRSTCSSGRKKLPRDSLFSLSFSLQYRYLSFSG
jgi:hypothetical protein